MAQSTSKGEMTEEIWGILLEQIQALTLTDFPSGYQFQVFEDYDCTLNQTNIKKNINKFYIIQLLHRSIGGEVKYFTWKCSGRVGEVGSNELIPFPDLASAKKGFKKKFKENTGNNWSKRGKFTVYPGKYTMIEVEHDNKEGGRTGNKTDKRMPLGMLSRAQIEKGLNVLENLQEELDTNDEQQELMDLSSLFYTNIPYNSGRKHPPIINSPEILKEKEDILQALLKKHLMMEQSLEAEKTRRRRADRPE